MRNEMIRERAETCVFLFQSCVEALEEQQNSASGSGLEITAKSPLLKLKEQHGRFRLWTSNIGVFARTGASLDYRLRDAPEVAGVVTGMLQVVASRLERAHKIVSDPYMQYPQDQATTAPLHEAAHYDGGQQRHEALEALTNAISRLQRVSTAIRRAGASSSLSRVESFVIRDKDVLITIHGGTTSVEPQESFDVDFLAYVQKVLDHRASRLPDHIRREVGSIIDFRRRRLCYAQVHQQKLSRVDKDVLPIEKKLSTPEMPSSRPMTEVPATEKVVIPRQGREPGEGSHTMYTETNASAFDQKNFVLEPTLSIASSRLSVSPVMMSNRDIPSAPDLAMDATEALCPYCCFLLPAKEFTHDRRWRRHIEHDLEPYLCLSEICLKQRTAFSSVKDWIRHINEQHSLQWKCPLHEQDEDTQTTIPGQAAPETPSRLIFDEKDAMEDHLLKDHADIAGSKARVVLRRSAKTVVSKIFQSCPFCDWLPEGTPTGPTRSPEQINVTQGHVASHLLSLALMALPWRDDILEEDGQDGAADRPLNPPSWQADAGDMISQFPLRRGGEIRSRLSILGTSDSDRSTQEDSGSTTLSISSTPEASSENQRSGQRLLEQNLGWIKDEHSFDDQPNAGIISLSPLATSEDYLDLRQTERESLNSTAAIDPAESTHTRSDALREAYVKSRTQPRAAPHSTNSSSNAAVILDMEQEQPESYRKRSKYKFGKLLGVGTGVVKEVKSEVGKFAVKMISKEDVKGNEQAVFDEISMMTTLKHPGITKCYDWFESNDEYFIIIQLGHGGVLRDRIHDKGRFQEEEACDLMREILDTVRYLHNHDIVHGNLQPMVFVYRSKSPHSPLLLGGFSRAVWLENPDDLIEGPPSPFGYTYEYTSPEILLDQPHSKPADMWSIGTIAYLLLCGYPPFSSETLEDIIEECTRDQIAFPECDWEDIGGVAKDFVLSLLQQSPRNRATIEEALTHPWILRVYDKNAGALEESAARARSRLLRGIEMVMLANRIEKRKRAHEDAGTSANVFREVVNAVIQIRKSGAGGIGAARESYRLS